MEYRRAGRGVNRRSPLLDDVITKEDILPLDEVYTRHIEKVLEMTNGKISGPGGAAEKLKTDPSALRKRMDKLGIPYGWVKIKT